jgi:hypothetical protein
MVVETISVFIYLVRLMSELDTSHCLVPHSHTAPRHAYI